MTDEAIAIAAALCRRFEGFYAQPYICPAGVPTIGYGTTVYPDGRAVTLRDAPVTREQAEALLRNDLVAGRLRPVLRLCPTLDTAGRLGAIVDFAYNLGNGALAASTLRRRIAAGQWDDVPGELRKWNRGGGRVLRGLVLRREAEAALI
jgi:lysozyme